MGNNIIPIILCGGKGTRLWPLSRQSLPKQFLNLYGEDKNSLLQQTQKRLSGLDNQENPIIICNSDHRFLVAEQMKSIGIKPKAIILEPVGRNTAPAVTLGALKANEENEESILLVLSADHKIENTQEFIKVIKLGYQYASEGRLVTFGIVPTRPETGYGYIESVSEFDQKSFKGLKIKRFIEKPSKELAKELISNKNFTWNSGIFMFQTKAFLEELKNHSPDVLSCCKKAMKKSITDLDFIRIKEEIFEYSPNISIDVAVMENTQLGTVLPLKAGWSDIGSWKSLWENEKKDINGNVLKGNTKDYKSKNCYLRSENKLLVTIGLKDLIVVETDDTVFISSKNEIDSLKKILEDLQNKGFEEIASHSKIYRPWGHYTSIAGSKNWQVKRIEVKPKSKLSLQMHNHRAEHWVVVSGTATVQIDKRTFSLNKNQSTFIPLGSTHRLSNESSEKLIIIEVQSGKYLGEDDIIRFKDEYGRK